MAEMTGLEIACAAGGLALVVAFGLCWLGGVVFAIRGLLAGLRLGRWMKTNAPGKLEELYVWDGIKMTGSNALFGMKAATPTMWKWVFRDEPGEGEELRALKGAMRRCIKGFFGCWIAAAVVLAALFAVASRGG